jgi:hypothetical protein
MSKTLSSIQVYVDRICDFIPSSEEEEGEDEHELMLSETSFFIDITGFYEDDSTAFRISPQFKPSDWPLINRAIRDNIDFCTYGNDESVQEDIFISNNVVNYTLQHHVSSITIYIPADLCREPFLEIENYIYPPKKKTTVEETVEETQTKEQDVEA